MSQGRIEGDRDQMTYPYVSRPPSSYRVWIRRACKRFDTGTILTIYHRNIYAMDMFNDIGHTGVLSCQRGVSAGYPMHVRL